MSLDNVSQYITAPSPRYWLLWPGVMMMLLYSAADVLIGAAPPIYRSLKDMRSPSPNPLNWLSSHNTENDEMEVATEDELIPRWAWVGGLLISIVMSCALLATQFHMNVGEGILALFLAFLFSFVGVQSSGHTDINPVSTVAKVILSPILYSLCKSTDSDFLITGFTTHLRRYRQGPKPRARPC
jgi:OPT oligopeptide transporter protein